MLAQPANLFVGEILTFHEGMRDAGSASHNCVFQTANEVALAVA